MHRGEKEKKVNTQSGKQELGHVEMSTSSRRTGRQNSYLPVMLLCEVSVDPVDDVESSVSPDAENVEQREGFSLLGLLQHEELRQDGNGLEVDRESP
eukprot:763194-Hanusia_phi.AAC.5